MCRDLGQPGDPRQEPFSSLKGGLCQGRQFSPRCSPGPLGVSVPVCVCVCREPEQWVAHLSDPCGHSPASGGPGQPADRALARVGLGASPPARCPRSRTFSSLIIRIQ